MPRQNQIESAVAETVRHCRIVKQQNVARDGLGLGRGHANNSVTDQLQIVLRQNDRAVLESGAARGRESPLIFRKGCAAPIVMVTWNAVNGCVDFANEAQCFGGIATILD